LLIDPFHADWLADMAAHYASLLERAHLVLLIDGAFVPGLFREPERRPLLLFESMPGCSEVTRDVSPILTQFDPADSSLMRALSRCDGWPMVSAITTFETIDRLYERLAAWCVVEVDGQRFNFRFPDTRRLPTIFAALTDKQRAEMAGSAVNWRYMDRDGTWRELACVLPKDEPPVTAHAQLDEEQFGCMVSDSEPDEMWVQLEGRGVTTRLRTSDRHAVLSAALSLARERRLDSIDAARWCTACLRTDDVDDMATLAARFASWTTKNMRTADEIVPTTA
jgi:hypothetical protein